MESLSLVVYSMLIVAAVGMNPGEQQGPLEAAIDSLQLKSRAVDDTMAIVEFRPTYNHIWESEGKVETELKRSGNTDKICPLQLDEAKKYRQQDRDSINKLNQQLADYESEINMLRRSMESLETERQRDKGTINRAQQEVDKLRADLDSETLAHIEVEHRRQTLEEEIEFMKNVNQLLCTQTVTPQISNLFS